MFSSNSPEPDLLRNLLEPLLDDFDHWFARSQILLETETLSFLDQTSQSALLYKIMQAQQEVKTARILLNATEGQVGIETSMLMVWHQLVAECWHIAIRHRLKNFSQEEI